MKIISHRGYWKTASEKNTPVAFQRSFELGFGTETDIRDLAKTLVMAHDPPSGNEMTTDAFFSLASKTPDLPLALNIKSDGLAPMLLSALNQYNLNNYFVFDMSVPDMRAYINQGMRVYTRHSEAEPSPAYYAQSEGIWLDGFEGVWYGIAEISQHISAGKSIAIVSEELHGRDPIAQWTMLKSLDKDLHSPLILCSDWPEKATEFFNQQHEN